MAEAVLTIERIADFCEFKDCAIVAGDPDAGYIQIDGNGIRLPNNYHRFLSFNELSGRPVHPQQVLDKATCFRLQSGTDTRELNRETFEAELNDFLAKVGH
ncbi:MAG: hypothetical protein HY645_13110 [Acidobacteria bacterium]|nr:hypothetical protein [Acidobacteriota bacterium]